MSIWPRFIKFLSAFRTVKPPINQILPNQHSKTSYTAKPTLSIGDELVFKRNQISKISEITIREEMYEDLDGEIRDRELEKISNAAMSQYHAEMEKYWRFSDWLFENFEIDRHSKIGVTNYHEFSFYPISSELKMLYGGGEVLLFTEMLNVVSLEFGIDFSESEEYLKYALTPGCD